MKIKLNKKIIVIFLILFISIGFAYLTTDLSISGITIIKRSVWDVHYENIVNKNEDVLRIDTPTTISNNNLKINFEVTLDQPGQEYSFYVDVVNKSTFDVALDTVSITGLSNEQKRWIKPIITYNDGIILNHNDILKENDKELLKVSIKYIDDLNENNLPTVENHFELNLNLKYNQADANSKERNHLEYVNRKNAGVISVGDEVAIDTEHFYVVSSDENKTVLLTKYNLLVGSNYNYVNDTGVKESDVDKNDPKYGIQSEEALGVTQTASDLRVGTLPYSYYNYWYQNGTFIPKYYDIRKRIQIYDKEKIAETGQEFSIASYVENYRNYLESQGMQIDNARLLREDEIESLGCILGDNTNISDDKKFLFSTSYWLQTVNQDQVNQIGQVLMNGYYRYQSYTYYYGCGVRPAIEISTSYLEKEYTITFDSNGGSIPIPASITKDRNEKIGDNYYKSYQIENTTTDGYNKVEFTIETITDLESPTGIAYKVTRLSSNNSTGPFWRLGRIIVGEPYLFRTTVKGTGSWHIRDEQLEMNIVHLNEEDGYKVVQNSGIATNNAAYSIIYYEISRTVGAYINIASAEVYHLLPETVRTGYTFNGWWTEREGGTRITNDTIVQENKTYYAQWIKNE